MKKRLTKWFIATSIAMCLVGLSIVTCSFLITKKYFYIKNPNIITQNNSDKENEKDPEVIIEFLKGDI